MPVKIYVGNYPSSFTEDDVLNLFQDYEGVELLGFFKAKNKRYSFMHCTSQRQLIEIVANLNAVDVCGRNLIVRAADENFQKKIEESISKYGSANFHPKDTTNMNSSFSETCAYSEGKVSKQPLPQQSVTSGSKNNQMGIGAYHSSVPNAYNSTNGITKQNEGISNNYENCDYLSNFSESNCSSQQNNHPVENSFSDSRENGASGYSQNLSKGERNKPGLGMNSQETNSKFSKHNIYASADYETPEERLNSYKTNSVYNRQNPSSANHQTTSLKKQHHTCNRNTSECLVETVQLDSYNRDLMCNRENSSSVGYQTNFREQYQARERKASDSSLETIHNKPSFEKYESLSYISVMNFPLYLPTRNLYELFSDFNPLKVFIVCNRPRMDRVPTEAIICFENEKNATDAILTLDNTMYKERVLIVTDAVDMSLVSELLSFK